MTFRSQSDRATPAMAEINIIPLCDVLLVLLIIFMVTAPALSQQIDLDLPQASRDQPQVRPDPIDLSIDATGQAYWNGSAAGGDTLSQLMQAAVLASDGPQPVLRIDADGDCDYQAVTTVLAQARNAGMTNIGFVRR